MLKTKLAIFYKDLELKISLFRSKDDYLDDMDSSELPPTMVKMEAMVYPKVDSEEEDEVQTRLEKRVFQSEDEDEVEDLSNKKPKLETNPGENNNSHSEESLKVKDEFKEKNNEEEAS